METEISTTQTPNPVDKPDSPLVAHSFNKRRKKQPTRDEDQDQTQRRVLRNR